MEKLSGVRQFHIYRINLDDNKTEFFRFINTNDESIVISFCKRFNALMKRSDFNTAYFYREDKPETNRGLMVSS